MTDGQISKLIGTTKFTITQIRERTHWNIANVSPKDPVMLGLCKQLDLTNAIDKARRSSRWKDMQSNLETNQNNNDSGMKYGLVKKEDHKEYNIGEQTQEEVNKLFDGIIEKEE